MIDKAKKYLNLLEEFEIEADGMQENIETVETEIINNLTPEYYKEENKSIIDTKVLIDDFSIIRKNLKENTKSLTLLITRLGQELSSSNVEDIDPDMVRAYSDLVKSNNATMKLLIDNYSQIAKIQSEVKKFMSNEEDEDSKGNKNITNNVFVGTTQDLVKNLLGD